MKTEGNEKLLRAIFDASLWLKAAFALSEVAGGIAAFFVSKQFLLGFVQWVFQDEFADDPHDFIATFFLHSVQGLTSGTLNFAAAYLLVHGVIKLWLIGGLLRERLWYYPTALVVFSLFVAYQLYRYTITHSVWLLLITAIDLAVIGLTWHEWRYLKQTRANQSSTISAV